MQESAEHMHYTVLAEVIAGPMLSINIPSTSTVSTASFDPNPPRIQAFGFPIIPVSAGSLQKIFSQEFWTNAL